MAATTASATAGGASAGTTSREVPLAAPATGVDRAGYLAPAYAAALSEFGRPLVLPLSGGHLLARPVPARASRDRDRADAMSCYPILQCVDWTALGDDLAALAESSLVTVTAITDPLAAVPASDLTDWFPDLARPFKRHYLVDLQKEPELFVSAHHRRNARRVLRHIDVEICPDPLARLDDWCRLYEHLVRRHAVNGVAAFSRASFAKQLTVPGIVALAAHRGAEIVGMQLWYRQGDRAYHHLSGFSPRGYRLGGASYGLMCEAIRYFRNDGLRWLMLGAGAGLRGDADDGLTRFKAGWSNAERTNWLCGRIFDREAYAALSQLDAGAAARGYFPAYRTGEFA